MPGGLIAIKINQKLKKDNVVDKNGKLLSITKSQVNRVLREKFVKLLKIRKVFYLNEEAKKRLEFCEKIIQMEFDGEKLEGKIFFLPMKKELILLQIQAGNR